jgi:hypothetical protein
MIVASNLTLCMLVYSQPRAKGRCDIRLQSVRRHIKQLSNANIQSCGIHRLVHHFNSNMRTSIKTTESNLPPIYKYM